MMDQSVDVADPSRADFFEQMALHGKDLRWVNVCMLKLDGECITKLLSLPRLQFLGLYGTNVLEEEIAECDKSIGVAAAFTKDQLLLGLHEVGRNNHDCAKGMLRTLFSMLCPDGGWSLRPHPYTHAHFSTGTHTVRVCDFLCLRMAVLQQCGISTALCVVPRPS